MISRSPPCSTPRWWERSRRPARAGPMGDAAGTGPLGDLCFLGLSGGIGHLCLIRSSRAAPASAVAPFAYAASSGRRSMAMSYSPSCPASGTIWVPG